MSDLTNNFEALYKQYYSVLCNAAENIVGDSDSAEDVVQEVFIKLWNKREEIDSILNPKAYLFRSVINTSITFLEKTKNKVRIDSVKVASLVSTDSNLMSKELEEKISAALDNLPAKCKAIFVLSRFENMKNKEIAEHLGVSIKTVENQMGIAFKKLRTELKPFLTKEFLSMLSLVSLSVLMREMIVLNVLPESL